jgi:hypothetical protein
VGARARRSPSTGTLQTGRHAQTGVDDEDAQARRAEGFDPDDPAVMAAIDMVWWELSLKPCLTIRSETGSMDPQKWSSRPL